MNARERAKLYEQQMGAEAAARQRRAAAARCKDCSAPVRWVKPRDGKPFLVDYDAHEAGSIIVWPDGHCLLSDPGAWAPPAATLHFRHAATCSARRGIAA